MNYPSHQAGEPPLFGVRPAWRATIACGLLLVAGCANEVVPRGSRYIVSSPTAQFYKNGPSEDATFVNHTFDNYLTEQQAGPDFQLPKGTRVTMVKHEYGFSRVVTENGVVGYMSNDQLKPAPAIARVAPTVVPSPRIYRTRVHHQSGAHKIEEPPLDMSDLPLPLPG